MARQNYGLWIIVPSAKTLTTMLASMVHWPVILQGVPGTFYEIPLGASEPGAEREVVLASTFLEVTLPAMYQQLCKAVMEHKFAEVYLIESALRHSGGDMAITSGAPTIGVVRHTNWVDQAYVSAQGTPRLVDGLVTQYSCPMHHALCVVPSGQAYEYEAVPVVTCIASFCYPFYTSMANYEIPCVALVVFSDEAEEDEGDNSGGGSETNLYAFALRMLFDVYQRTPRVGGVPLCSLCQVCTQQPATHTIVCGHCSMCQDCVPATSLSGAAECFVCGLRITGVFPKPT